MEGLLGYFFSALLLVLYFDKESIHAHGEWHYPDLGKGEDFPKWGGTCDTGLKQSPVALTLKNVYVRCFPKSVFENYNKPLRNPRVVNTGHSVEVRFDQGLRITGSGYESGYNLLSFHFHWPSEHTIEGKRFALELHLVHMSEEFKTLDEALQKQNGLAVLGVLFDIGKQTNPNIAKILKYIEQIAPSNKVEQEVPMKEDIILDEFLPSNPGINYYYYDGSLTTPGCAEAVLWTVFDKTKEVTLEQIVKFKTIAQSNGNILRSNYRFIQNTTSDIQYINSNIPATDGSDSKHLNLLTISFVNLLYIVIH